jgi:hypothetical protein
MIAHESNPRMNVMTRLIQAQCVQTLLRRGNIKSSLRIKHLMGKLVPLGTDNYPHGGPRPESTVTKRWAVYSYSERLGAWVANCSSCGWAGRLPCALA